MLYDLKNQEVFSGGSGSACVALVTFGFLKNRLETGKLKRILLVATGALFSPTMIQQKKLFLYCSCSKFGGDIMDYINAF